MSVSQWVGSVVCMGVSQWVSGVGRASAHSPDTRWVVCMSQWVGWVCASDSVGGVDLCVCMSVRCESVGGWGRSCV